MSRHAQRGSLVSFPGRRLPGPCGARRMGGPPWRQKRRAPSAPPTPATDPTTGSFGWCARAASGHAIGNVAVAAASGMKSPVGSGWPPDPRVGFGTTNSTFWSLIVAKNEALATRCVRGSGLVRRDRVHIRIFFGEPAISAPGPLSPWPPSDGRQLSEVDRKTYAPSEVYGS